MNKILPSSFESFHQSANFPLIHTIVTIPKYHFPLSSLVLATADLKNWITDRHFSLALSMKGEAMLSVPQYHPFKRKQKVTR
jgi:hypothetical protein